MPIQKSLLLQITLSYKLYVIAYDNLLHCKMVANVYFDIDNIF